MRRAHTSRPKLLGALVARPDQLWLETSQATWERLPDEVRLHVPEPATSNLPECDILKLYALEKSDRTREQCAWLCD